MKVPTTISEFWEGTEEEATPHPTLSGGQAAWIRTISITHNVTSGKWPGVLSSPWRPPAGQPCTEKARGSPPHFLLLQGMLPFPGHTGCAQSQRVKMPWLVRRQQSLQMGAETWVLVLVISPTLARPQAWRLSVSVLHVFISQMCLVPSLPYKAQV